VHRLVVYAAFVILCASAVAVGAGAQTTGPAASARVQVTPASAAPGEEVAVELANWPAGPAQASVCGNNAARGSQDCDLIGTKGVSVRRDGASFRFEVTAPPIHCPCVVRVTSANGDLVRQAPIDVQGHPVGPEVLPTSVGPVSAVKVPIRARLVDAKQSIVEGLAPLVAGPVEKTLLVTVRNDSSQSVEQIRVVASVGRSRSEAEPLSSTTIDALAPGESTTARVPVRIGVPAWGRYEVFGSVYGLDVPGRFSTTTSNDPWGLEIVLPALVLLLAWMARRRERREDEQLLHEDSPVVGSTDEDRSLTPSYAPTHALAT